MSKAKTKPAPAAEPPDDAPALDRANLEWRATPAHELTENSLILGTLAREGIETAGDLYDVLSEGDEANPWNLTDDQIHQVCESLDKLGEGVPGYAPFASGRPIADEPVIVEAAKPEAAVADDLLFKAKSFDQVAELNREVRRLQADWERKHTTASIAKKEYEKESAKLSALIAERVDELTAPSLFPVGGEADSGIPENRNEDRLAELQMKYPLTADKWTKYGLTEKDVEKLAAGETRHHGVHPLYTYGDVGRFVKDPQTGFERRLTDIKGLGEAAYNRWLDAELKFQQDWPTIAAAFAAEIGFDLGTQEPADASQPGAGSGDGGEGGQGEAATGAPAEPTLADFAGDRNPLPDATAEPKPKRKAKAKPKGR
jgi:hypothetical protein